MMVNPLGLPPPSTQVAAAYDKLADRYDGSYVRKADKAEDRAVVNLLRGHASHGDRVLDMGCGTGWFIDHFNHPEDLFVGVDVSEGMLSEARIKHPGHDWRHGNMVELEDGVGVFDAVISTFGPANYVEPEALGFAVHRHLRKGGRFFIQAYTPGYRDRPSYVMREEDLERTYWTPELARSVFAGTEFFRNVQTRHLWSGRCERMAEALGPGMGALYARWETAISSLVNNGTDSYWLIVTGERA